MGIRAKLVLCLLAVLLPLAAVSAISFHWFDQQLKERTETSLSNTLRLEALRIEGILENYAQDARNLAADARVNNFVTAVTTYRRTNTQNTPIPSSASLYLEDRDDITSVDLDSAWPLQWLALDLQRKAGMAGSSALELRITDREGLTLGETMGFSWNPKDPSILRTAMSTVKTVFAGAFVTNTNQRHLAIVSPIMSPFEEVVGTVVIEVPMKLITSVVSMHERAGQTTEAYIAQPTDKGAAQLITALRFDRKSAYKKTVAADENLPINIAMHATAPQITTALDYRGIETIAALQKIKSTGWGLVVKIDTSEAYAPVVKLRNNLSIAATAALLLILLGYTILLGPIAHRLKKTALTAQTIKSGDLTVRVGDLHNDEIGKLARTIDSLAEQLHKDHQKRLDVEEQLRHQATHDELTGLLNRKHANKLIEELDDANNQAHSVMFLDLNGFKDVNDYYGHATGDEVLTSVAGRLLNAIPNNATLARWGGDEFVIILPHTDAIAAQVLTADIHAVFDTPVSTREGIHKISTSIGLATSNTSQSLRETLTEADSLMYEDKRKTRSTRTISNIAERTLERALQEERIELWYEPIISRGSDGNETLTAAESKIRIRTKDGGIVLPEELLLEINNAGLIIRLYEHALKESRKSVSRWKQTNIVPEKFRLIFDITPGIWEIPEFTTHVLPHFSSEDVALSSKHDRNAHEQTNLCTDVIKIKASEFTNKSNAIDLVESYKDQGISTCIEGIDSREAMPSLALDGALCYQGQLFDKPLRAVDFISRWGRPSSDNPIPLSDKNFKLRLAG
ncbi:MAG: diguanylate cyclase [Granulosicoccus sp.]